MSYFEMMVADHESIIETMLSNMHADLDAGYDPNGKSITMQKHEIAEYIRAYNAKMDYLKLLTVEKGEKAVERWCRIDLIKRGAILPTD